MPDQATDYRNKRIYGRSRASAWAESAERLVNKYGVQSGTTESPATTTKRRGWSLRDAYRRLKGTFGQKRTYIGPNVRGENRRFMEDMAQEP